MVTTSRRALLRTATAVSVPTAVAAGLSGCGVIASRSSGDPQTPSADGSSPSPQSPSASPTPRQPFDGWGRIADLDTVDLDLAALDAVAKLSPSSTSRTDRFGSWRAPQFAKDSPITQPSLTERRQNGKPPFGDDALPGKLLSAAVRTVLDSPVAFEKTNERHTEASPEIIAAIGETADPHALDEIFQSVGLNGGPEGGEGFLDQLDAEPEPYSPNEIRFHIGASGAAVRAAGIQVSEMPLVEAAAVGYYPIVLSDGTTKLLMRTVGLSYGASDAQALVGATLQSGTMVHVKDADAVPQHPGVGSVPADWTAITHAGLSLKVPPAFADGAEALDTSVGARVGDETVQVMQFCLPSTGPVPVTHVDAAARVDVPGADYAVAAASTSAAASSLGSTPLAVILVATPKDQFWIDVIAPTAERLEELVEGIIASLSFDEGSAL
ncbi:hypothetical protein [Helcobacillus massiliensis]|uniref:Uncharacterized protein n=1 Tax=Helcobacillus massiliensis TaxID=521392 RepID=A0A839QQ75_9MICO|nr:hypothetical protein [Helcobacillus massiliensis]MBB3022152.1 hypothetical protein [Helcobacillus massiliensis]